MAATRSRKKPPLKDIENAFRRAAIFLTETGECRIATAIFPHPVRQQHWIRALTAESEKENIHLTECRLPATGEPRLIDELIAHLRDVPTLPGKERAVIVTGISQHLPDASDPKTPGAPRPRFAAEINIDRELFPIRCPHPLILGLTLTAYSQLRRHAPDTMHWVSQHFDFSEPAPPGDSPPLRGISELQHSNTGTTYANLTELHRAEGVFRTGLAATIAAHGPTHLETVRVRANLANVLDQLGHTPDALTLAEENMRLVENASGVPEIEIAHGRVQLAFFLKTLGRMAEAELHLRLAIPIYEAHYGPSHPETATALNNLAQLLQDTNRLAEAEPLMRRALAIDEASFGENHPDVARDLNNLATLLQDTNRLAEAEPLMRRALAIDEASYGDAHPTVARDLNNLAQLLQDTNRLAEAEPLMRRALGIAEASYGDSHPTVAIRLNNLAQLLKATNRLAACRT